MRIEFRACCLALLAALCCARTLAVEPGKPLEPPNFFVQVVLTPDAEAWLRKTGETIWISGLFEDEVGPDGIWLGKTELTLTTERLAHIHGIRFHPRLAQLMTGFDYEVLINVGSGRKTSDLNYLDCELLQGPISQFQGRTSQIGCQLAQHGPPAKSVRRFTGEMDGKEFLALCSSVGLASAHPAQRRNEAFCTGYVKGVIHAHDGFLSDEPSIKRHFCIPRGVSDLDFTRAAVKYLEASGVTDYLGTYTLAALHVTYRCKPNDR